MVIFSILLLISRLIPAFQLTDSNNLAGADNDNDALESEELVESNRAYSLEQSREQSIDEFIKLIKGYSKSGTYFVRKISA